MHESILRFEPMTVPIHPARGEMTQGTKPRRRWRAGALSAAESYPTSEVRDSSPECQAAMVQERPGGATLRPRSGAVAERSYPKSEVGGDGREEIACV